jgi:hypothetical protein
VSRHFSWASVSRIAALTLVLAGSGSQLFAYSLSGEKWTTSPITMQLQLGASATPLLDGSASWGASAEDALSTWNSYIGSVRFAVVRNSTATIAQSNRQNNVFFSPNVYGQAWGSGVLAVTLSWYSGTAQLESDVLFNSTLPWDSYRGALRYGGSGAIYDFHRVALHEFGHVLGLNHPDAAGQSVVAIMNSTISNLDALTTDDISGARSLYGQNASAGVAPTITTQPASQTISAGQSVTFSVIASGSPTPTYQWSKNGAAISGATGTSLTLSNVSFLDAGGYTATISNSVGATTSSTATLTVLSAPAITAQPVSQTVNADAQVSFSVAASGTAPLSYVWKKNGTSITGTTQSTFTIASAQPADAASYTVLVSNSVGSVTSAAATLSVTSAPTIATPLASQSVNAGDAVTFTVAANGTAPLSYAWFKSGLPIVGATQASLVIPSAQSSDADTYSVTISNAAGSTASSASLTVATPPTISAQPLSQAVLAGNSISLLVAAAGSPTPTYQWTKNGADVTGATAASLSIAAAQTSDAGTYAVRLANRAGTITSSSAVVSVSTAPQISLAPTSQTVRAGDTVTLAVSASGTPAPAYQWQHDGVIIPGATGATLALTAAEPSDAGAYAVVVTNSTGSATTPAATVTVNYSELVNLSTRGLVPAGGALTPGFVLRGSTSKSLVIRATGPALTTFGVSSTLTDPQLTLFDEQSRTVVTNDTWSVTPGMSTAFASVGAFALTSGSTDAAATANVAPGSYTVRVNGATSDMSGVALAEIYNADAPTARVRLVNVSTLGFVGTGDNVLAAGFTIRGNISKRVLIRAVGPGLTQFKVGSLLANPRLDVYAVGQSSLFATNDDWGGDPTLASAFTAAGAFQLDPNSRDAAIVLTLAPGGYTVVVSGSDGTTGNALVEVYDLDP